jgi:hypothetical protein
MKIDVCYQVEDRQLNKLIADIAPEHGLSGDQYVEKLLKKCMDAGLIKPPVEMNPDDWGDLNPRR